MRFGYGRISIMGVYTMCVQCVYKKGVRLHGANVHTMCVHKKQSGITGYFENVQ